jgi:hypothetical protein
MIAALTTFSEARADPYAANHGAVAMPRYYGFNIENSIGNAAFAVVPAGMSVVSTCGVVDIVPVLCTVSPAKANIRADPG